jgi:molybdenum-dependent DNA-binding transcriptional regulator ModE
VKEAGLSPKTLPGLLAALSAAGGRGPDEFFPQGGEQLGRRMGREGRGAQGFARRWTRAWKLIEAEQQRIGLTLVERREGGRDPVTRRKLRSEYRVPLLQLIVDLEREARQLRGTGLKRHELFDLAARRLVGRLPRESGTGGKVRDGLGR